MIFARYPTDLTDTDWAVLAPLIPAAKAGGRPRTTDMRKVVNAVFYILRSGCQWRLLPKDFPPHQTVCDVTIRGIELAEKIKKQQFNLKPLTGKATTAPEIWAAVLAA